MLGIVKPRSKQTLHHLYSELADPSPWVECRTAESLGRLGVSNAAIVFSLRQLQSSSTNELVVVKTSTTLWELEKDPAKAFDPVIRVLEHRLEKPFVPPPWLGSGSGGQGVSADEELFTSGSELFPRMKLSNADKARALAVLEAFCEKSG